MSKTAVIVGAGASKGLGAALARRFAGEGLHVIIASRTAERVAALARSLRETGAAAETRQADATDEASVVALFAALPGELEIAVYNAGVNVRAPLVETSAELFERLWRHNAFGGFLVGREAARRMTEAGRGTLILTGATASLRARPPFGAFAAGKAALRAVAQGFARECGPQGVHVAHVIIDGVIRGEAAESRLPEFVAAKGEDGLLEPDAIADAYWALHRQPRSAWTHELDLRPFKENF